MSKLPTIYQADERADRAPREWPKFMTARVAADYCDTSPWTIRRHIRPCGRRGRSHVFSKESVEAWMRGNPVTVRNGAASVAAAASSLARIHSLAEYRQRRRGDHLADDDNDMQT